MWISLEMFGTETDQFQQLNHPINFFLSLGADKNAHRPSDDVDDLHARIQRRVWILKNHLNLFAPFPTISLVISRAAVDLPQPLSPTRPKTLPSGTAKEIRSTALRILRPAIKRLDQPPLTSKCLVRSLTSRSGIMHPEN